MSLDHLAPPSYRQVTLAEAVPQYLFSYSDATAGSYCRVKGAMISITCGDRKKYL
jgi:hypothetical protein